MAALSERQQAEHRAQPAPRQAWGSAAGQPHPEGSPRRRSDVKTLRDQVERGDAGRPAAADTAARLWALRDRWRLEFPGGDRRAEALLPALAAALASACEAEEAALAALAAALPS
jgi:hypothetical protein